ncbi:acyl-CoA thioesterase [Parendozoicomonas haliclonae]|uniref:Thioesterase superfamily protein n=1 Tax=Parendozoicomonas haliclonae TaxID=1960125 RepID=A0A1X7AH54_9GAMM|nr:thioesterase family protein [Parendozoicomonas haliclonae]SMA40233.1 Thioesterase superfamily protein [Parendozoicomonas haliclonae]
MFVETLAPRFCETDALGHINNTVVPVWFEAGREPIFQLFTPDMDVNNWKLIIARISVDFLAEIHYGTGRDVEIRTGLAKIGNSSMTIRQEVWQEGQCCARGDAVMIHFDHSAKQSRPIPDTIRAELEKHLLDVEKAE